MADSAAFEEGGVRVAVEGCGHGTLNAIYASAQRAAEIKGWDKIDLLIIGGDFQAVRNAADLTVMSVPAKYRELGDFPAYYGGLAVAPVLTIFIGGNHEANSHLWELFYGGWVAPNIYYLGAANVLRFGPLRVAGMSGIWKGFDYKKPHHERLPFSQSDIKGFYHVREIDVRKLLLVREQVDIGLSHDWPRAIENHGDANSLWRMKPDFKRESLDGTLGNPAAGYVMNRLRPPYWFSAHMHCKFTAIRDYSPAGKESAGVGGANNDATSRQHPEPSRQTVTSTNPDEIDLDLDDEGNGNDVAAEPQSAPEKPVKSGQAPDGVVSEELRSQLPASFLQNKKSTKAPVPSSITNTVTRFIALDKALPGRKFLQLLDIIPASQAPAPPPQPPFRLQYDPEWLAITRVFHQYLSIGDRETTTPSDLGEGVYAPMIDKERAWVDEHIVQKNKLDVPENFTFTAPPHSLGDPERTDDQPEEYTNPQTAAFCELLELKNLWDATPEERAARKEAGPPPDESLSHRGGFRGGRGGGRGGRGRGQGRGGWGRGRGRGR